MTDKVLDPDPNATPANYVRFPGIGLVHVGVFIAAGGLLAWLTYRAVTK